jgi:hypothetical protein
MFPVEYGLFAKTNQKERDGDRDREREKRE